MFRLMRLQERNFTIWRGNVKSYLKMDFYRMLTSKYFGIGILGVVGVYGFSLVQLKSQDVYLLNYYIKFYSTYMLLLIFGAVAYSNAMMEDLEYKNYYLQIQKGSFRKYIWSKVITAFISAVIVMVLGTSIFCLMAHFKMSLLSPDNDMLEYLAEGDYLSQLITPETIFWYLIADAAMTGLMAGIFSVFAMWLSLFVKNQMFTVMVPIVGFYFFVNYFTRIFGENDYFKLNVIYISNGKIFETSFSCFCYALFVAVAIAAITGKLIYSKMQNDIWGDRNVGSK